MKRTVAFVTCLLLVLCCFSPVVVSAVSGTGESFNILDFYTVNNSGSQSYTGSLPMTLRYTLPDKSVNFVDIIVRTNIADLRIFVNGKRLCTYLLLSDNGNYTYRIADYLSQTITSEIKLGINGTSGDFIQFEKFLVNYYLTVDLGCAYTLNSCGYTESVIQAANQDINTSFTEMENDLPIAFNLYLWPDDSNKYDFIDIFIFYQGYGLDSIAVSYDGTYVPFEASYTSDTYMTFGEKYIMLRLDLSSVERITGIDPLVRIAGSYDSNYTGYLCVESVVGIVASNQPNTIQAFWLNLKSFLSDLLGYDSEQDGNADDFNQEVEDQTSELDQMTQIMGSIEKPEISEINMDVAGMADTSIVTLTTSGISSALSNEILIRVLLMALTFALVGFILYGKK